MPMYIFLDDKEKPLRAYSGFFLSGESIQLVHLEWSNQPEVMVERLHEYFDKKWEKWNPDKQSSGTQSLNEPLPSPTAGRTAEKAVVSNVVDKDT